MLNRYVLGLVIAVASGGVARASQGQMTVGTSVAPTPIIVTTGTGESRVAPDRATIMIGVQSRATTAAAAAAENARRQRAILDTLRAIGLASNQLSTVNYNVNPEMQYPQNGQGTPRVIAYVVTNTVRAEVRRLDDVARVIDAALAKGANEISSLEFSSSQADSARRAALGLAVSNARLDANALALAAGGTLGSVIEISTAESPIRPVPQVMLREAAAAKTPIEPGEQTVTATVTVRWSFVPATRR
jgi:uncharacterized protein YggE